MEISGFKAIDRMRNLAKVPNTTFGLVFIKCNLTTGKAGELRKIERCRLRPARPDEEGLANSQDHYLFFTDVDTDEPKQCWKKLIRQVCFPPSDEWLKVNWF